MAMAHPGRQEKLFSTSLLSWFKLYGRDLPWRRTPAAYPVLVAEFMLQQTHVHRVKKKFTEFISQFPTLADLTQASKADVIRAWSGMGYNRRALLLHAFARVVAEKYQGNIPHIRQELLKLPGIGPYTAGAIASFAYNQPEPAIDVNIRRIYTRYFQGKDQGLPLGKREEQKLCALVKSTIPRGKSRDLHNALMDFGSLVCTRKAPACGSCPLQEECRFFPLYMKKKEKALFVMEKPQERGIYQGARFIPNRIFRGRIVEYARQHDGEKMNIAILGRAIKEGYAPQDEAWLLDLCHRLERDGLLHPELQAKTITLCLPR